MKIAYVYDAIYPWVKGGVEKRIWELSKRLAEKHEVHIYGINWWDGEDVIRRKGITIHGVCDPVELYADGRRTVSEAVYFARKVFGPLLEKDFDLIDCQEFPYLHFFPVKAQAFLKNTALVTTWHEVWNDYWLDYLGNLGIFGKFVEKIISRLSSHNIAVSERAKIDLENIGVSSPKVIPNGIDFETIHKVEPSQNESDFIFAGRLIKEKNIDIFLKALKKAKEERAEINCTIIGEGPEEERLKNLSIEFGLEDDVAFMNFIEDYSDFIGELKSSQVFVSSSTREGFGITALEANASGLPIVTVDHPRNAMKDLIKQENGFVVELSAKELSRKMLEALDREMSKECEKVARKYDWNKITRKIESYYEKKINQSEFQ